ncbi:MAG: PH-like domain-containing protein, partial [Pseudolysinimonas sp.]
ESSVAIAADAILGAGTATWTIDRVVDADGLVFVRWLLGTTGIDSYLRSANPDRLVSALTELTAPTPPPGAKEADA